MVKAVADALKVMGSIPIHDIEEFGGSSYDPLLHPTQVQWVLGIGDDDS